MSTPKQDAHTDEPAVARASTMLADLAAEGTEDTIAIGHILDRFHTRAYGVLLLLVLVPAFIPLPVGAGAISGPLVSLIGLQMLLTLRAPWLPKQAQRKQINRSTLARFAQRMQRLLGKLENMCRPRLIGLTQYALAHVFTGCQLILLGILLSLPIPLTNYPFALLLLLYAISIIERDGALLLLTWVLGCSAIIISALFSTEVISFIQRLLLQL